jgi:hypothetical protein
LAGVYRIVDELPRVIGSSLRLLGHFLPLRGRSVDPLLRFVAQ